MTELFIHSSAFEVLNQVDHLEHSHAIEFVQSLLSDSLTIFTSVDEVVRAASTIKREVGEAKEEQFLSLVFSGGIRFLYDDHSNLQNVTEVYFSLKKKEKLDVSDVQCAMLMKRYGVKHMLAFNSELSKLGVIVVPKT